MTQAVLLSAVEGWRIAVVGAGCAGLTAARRLAGCGAAVTLFEKSGGVGGRLATRHAGTRHFDHGAQYLTARGAAFVAEMDALCAQGAAAPWEAAWAIGDGDGITAEPVTTRRFAGIGGMNNIARSLAEGLEIVRQAEIVDLSRLDHHWTLECRGGERHPGFDAVVLAVPAPQAVPLLTGIAGFAIEVAAATYAPCWAVMVEFATRLDIPFDAVKLDDPALAWAAREAGKPGGDRSVETWVLHAAADWSLTHLEEPAEVIPGELLDRFFAVFGVSATVVAASAHRWRYAQVLETASAAYFWDRDLKLGACGDWCLGARVEAAFDSGLALARHMIGGDSL